MSILEVKGIISPLITPFTSEGEIYGDGLRRLLDFQIEKGVHGIWLSGTYGAGPLMTVEQRKRLVEMSVRHVGGKMSVIVHVGSSSPDSVIELARHAEKTGADAIGSVPPFYYPYKENEVFNFFSRLISSVDLPVFAYNNPARTGFDIKPDLLNKLASIGLAGVKDSSFNLIQFYEYLTTVEKNEFTFIIGTEALLLPAMIAGAKGSVSGLANVLPEVNVEAYKAIKGKKWKEAVDLQLKIIRARRVMHIASTMPACYAVLKMRGIDVGVPKNPISPLTEEESARIRTKLQELGLI